MLFRAGDDFGLMPKLFGAMTVAVAVSEEPIREGVSQLLRAGKHATSHAWAFAHDVRLLHDRHNVAGQLQPDHLHAAERLDGHVLHGLQRRQLQRKAAQSLDDHHGSRGHVLGQLRAEHDPVDLRHVPLP